MNAVHVEHLTKIVRTGFVGRTRTLLDNVSFHVAERAAVAFVGPNGAGKSTTLRHLIGGSRPTSGTVRVFGLNPAVSSTRRSFGYLPDLPALPPQLSARETLELHSRLAGVSTDLTLLDDVGLSDTARAETRTFSKGMQTRLGLALALVGRPQLLLLDEPMSGLDPAGRREVRDLIRSRHAMGTTIFFSTHVLADVESLCDSIVVINRGQVLFCGSVLAAMGASAPRAIFVPATTDEALLRGYGPVERQGEQLSVVVDVDDPFTIIASLHAQGVMVNELRRQSPRLEDRVLELLRQRPAS